MTANPIRHSCAATARLGLVMRVPGPVRFVSKPRPKPPHSILADIPAIEGAVASLLKLSKANAIARGITPEVDLAAQRFREEHGDLAALIADPVGEAAYRAAAVLMAHISKLNRPEDYAASSARIEAMAGPESRYAADRRPWH